ncbi:hypothetical protein EG329_006175 [Mollisiaceae sp. DMI_Dod_QoI]|nr:hypothetical protein EG329_006175 [Helotiales sp. DMI_Dod_QoI]
MLDDSKDALLYLRAVHVCDTPRARNSIASAKLEGATASEKRLPTQVEDLLKKHEATEGDKQEMPTAQQMEIENIEFSHDISIQMPVEMEKSFLAGVEDKEIFPQHFDPMISFSQPNQAEQPSIILNDDSLWAMIELGVEEPLPPQDTIDELTQIYFNKIHPSAAIIHQYRYLASLNLPATSRPPISLRYAMWAHAASVTASYMPLHSHFHLRARKYAEIDETSARQKYINVRHAQA